MFLAPSVPYGYSTLNAFLDRVAGPTTLLHDAVGEHVPVECLDEGVRTPSSSAVSVAAAATGSTSPSAGGGASASAHPPRPAHRRVSQLKAADLHALRSSLTLPQPRCLAAVPAAGDVPAPFVAVAGDDHTSAIATRVTLCKSVQGLWVQVGAAWLLRLLRY